MAEPLNNENDQTNSPSNTSEEQAAETSQVSASGKKSGKKKFLLLLIPLLLGGLFAGWQAWTYRAEGTVADVPSWSPEGPPSNQLPPKPASLPAGCAAEPQPFAPSEFVMDRQNITVRMLSLGLDKTGAAAAPPDNELRLIGWFNQGPKPGSKKGKVLLTAHTFVNQVALGNELNSGLLKSGDIVRVQDKAGNVACYQYTHAAKIWVKDYDPDSNAVYDNEGKPEIALVVCADWNTVTRESDSRIVYYFKLLTKDSV